MLRQTFILALILSFVPLHLSAQPLDRMISPVSNPVNFEDPRIRTEARLIYLYHKLDDDFVTGGGNVQIAALQLRYAVNDRLAIIATKDGYVWLRPDNVVPDDNGFGNIAGGVKYAFYKDEHNGQIMSAGLRYEIPVGNRDVLQGEGDGILNVFLSGASAFESFNVIAGTGFRIPVDGEDSTFYDFDLHVDAPMGNFFPGLEVNVVHVLDAGRRLPVPDEVPDYFNLGAIGAEGETIVTGAAVSRYRFDENLDFGVSYQFPLSNGEGTNAFDWRITTDIVASY